MTEFARRLLGDEQETDAQLTARLIMFLLAWFAQLATILISWRVWCIRESPPNLPLFGLPEFSFGPAILFSLFLALCVPRWGVLVHGAALVVGCLLDQHRLEPQFFGNWILLWACVSWRGAWFGRWFLASMWVWAGLNKFLSPEWLGITSWQITKRAGFDPHAHLTWAVLIASVEVLIGVIAAWTRRPAAVGCLLMHGGILIFLTPSFYNANISVWPWNAATAVVGAWMFWPKPNEPRPLSWSWVVVTFLFVYPASYYAGWINPHMAHVLYSSHMPKGWITSEKTVKKLHGWGGLAVPFPDSHALFRQTLERTAAPGDKLYIQDARRLIADRFYVLNQQHQAEEIDREAFLRAGADSSIEGVLFGDRNAAFQLERLGAKLERNKPKQVISLRAESDRFRDAQMALVAKLPNLKELKLTSVEVTKRGLDLLQANERLEILVINDVSLVDADLEVVAKLPNLSWLDISGSNCNGEFLDTLDGNQRLEVLHLARTPITKRGLQRLSQLEAVTWLDVSSTSANNETVADLAELKNCTWLNLRNTKVDDQSLAALKQMRQLEVLDIRDTAITLGGAKAIRAALPDCQVEH